MSKERTEVGLYDGERYILKYTQIGNEFPHLIDDYGPDDRRCKAWGWYLYLMGEVDASGERSDCYLGAFNTKAEAMEELDYAVRALTLKGAPA